MYTTRPTDDRPSALVIMDFWSSDNLQFGVPLTRAGDMITRMLRVINANQDDACIAQLNDSDVLKELSDIEWHDPILDNQAQNVEAMEAWEERSKTVQVLYSVKDKRFPILQLLCRQAMGDAWEGVCLFPSEAAAFMWHLQAIALNDCLDDVDVLRRYGRRCHGDRKRREFSEVFY